MLLFNSLENFRARSKLTHREMPLSNGVDLMEIVKSYFRTSDDISTTSVQHQYDKYVVLMPVLCQFYVGFMSVLCQFDVYLRSNNSLIINYLSSKLCRMSVVFTFFFSLKLLLLANSVSFLSLIVQITQIFSAKRRCFPFFCYLRNPSFNHIFRRADEK